MIEALPIAHFRLIDKKSQTLWEHLAETSEWSGQFAKKIDLEQVGRLLGLLHDMGKASRLFQQYIGSAEGLIDPDKDDYVDATALRGKVDHSSAGAQLIYQHLSKKPPKGPIAAQILSLCLASHHSGLIDCLSPDGINKFGLRMEKPEQLTHTQESLVVMGEVKQEIQKLLSSGIEDHIVDKLNRLKEPAVSDPAIFVFKCGLLVRYLFSCLIDADRLSTADFENPGNLQIRSYGQYHAWETLIQRLDNKLQKLNQEAEDNEVNRLRSQVSQTCLDFSTQPKGIYRLAVPTGGGKTLSTLRFSLNHARCHNMDRIFYIIPYTSIIDQNADEVRKILEDKDSAGRIVLEHHSNLTPEEETKRQSLLSQNWDAPVVFTTQVQFLETLFGAGTRNARRMHQLANAVIIFDEVQTIPVNCVHLFNLALRFLVRDCGSTVVLCTATQPLLDQVSPPERALIIDRPMIPDEAELFKKLKRVEVFDRRKVGGWADSEVADLVEQALYSSGSVLVIVNTKKSARSLYQALVAKKLAPTYHLSTNMCPAHRLEALTSIKALLADARPVICISTQLIEAGVDIDFGAVIRYLAGLDSIIQAAGRCNRSGKQPGKGPVWIINPADENIDRLKDIRIGVQVAERVLDEFNKNPAVFENDCLGLSAVSQYYRYYFFERHKEMCYPVGPSSPVGRDDNLFNLLSANSISVEAYKAAHQQALPPLTFRQSFQTAAKAFHTIDSPTIGVIVPYREEGKKLMIDLCGASGVHEQNRLLKQANRFSVNLYADGFRRLVSQGAVRETQEGSGIYYLDPQYYSNEFGWVEEAVNDMEVLISD